MKRVNLVVTLTILVTGAALWSDECQPPKPNCPNRANGAQGRCSDGRSCVWVLNEYSAGWGAFCAKELKGCTNHNPRAGKCNARVFYEVFIRHDQCMVGNQPCRTEQCTSRVVEGNLTGFDCRGQPCAQRVERPR